MSLEAAASIFFVFCVGDEYDGNVVVRLTSDRREFSIEVNGSRLLPLRG